MTLFIHRHVGGRCPCGAANAACGGPSDVVPVDQLIEEVAAVSGPLKKYKVVRGGVETVMKLSDDDAKRLGVGADDLVDGASTIEPVQAAESAAAEDGPGEEGADEEGADEEGADEEGAGPDDGQETDAGSENPQDAKTDTTAAAKKTPAKRRPASANKARTSAATKADGGS